MLIPNESLIREVMIKATGANIHKLRGRIGFYRSSAVLFNEEKSVKWKEEFEKTETALRRYVSTGSLV